WSARSSPATGADSIWIAAADRTADGRTAPPALANPSTRRDAETLLTRLLAERTGGATLVGIDVALGYPVGTADAFGLPAPAGVPAWRRMWATIEAAIVDDRRNRNNRFE